MRSEEAYEALYELVGAKKEDHFIFTSSGAESVNHVVFAAYLDITRKTGKNHFVCASLDEAPAIMAMSRLAEVGCSFEMIPANHGGLITPQAVAETITPRTAMVSLSWANALTGQVQPVSEIAEICQERGIFFHVEATHVLGKGYDTFEASGADVLSFDATAGTGGLFIKEGVELSPFILGGMEQGQMRAGRIHSASFFELGQMAKEALRFRDYYCMEMTRLRDLFEEKIGRKLFAHHERLPHVSPQIFTGANSDALFYLLKSKGINNVSFGGNRFQHMMHLLQACGIDEFDAKCGVSFTFSQEILEKEVGEIAEKTLEVVEQLRHYSKFFVGNYESR